MLSLGAIVLTGRERGVEKGYSDVKERYWP